MLALRLLWEAVRQVRGEHLLRRQRCLLPLALWGAWDTGARRLLCPPQSLEAAAALPLLLLRGRPGPPRRLYRDPRLAALASRVVAQPPLPRQPQPRCQ